MADADPLVSTVPLAGLAPEEKARRAGSFGAIASHYERYRPGPPIEALDWLLPGQLHRVVDLGAGTGALTRLLVGRAGDVVAVEPDDRMRSVLVENVTGARAVAGRGESIPLPDGSADAVLASSSWHWMDPVPTLQEVARVLVPGGVLGALWSGPDPEGPFLAQARELLRRPSSGSGTSATGADDGTSAGRLTGRVLEDATRRSRRLEIPAGMPFAPAEEKLFRWDVALDADELIGLLGTFSRVITMPPQTRRRVLAEARRLLRESLGVEGPVTVDVTFRCATWRSYRHQQS